MSMSHWRCPGVILDALGCSLYIFRNCPKKTFSSCSSSCSTHRIPSRTWRRVLRTPLPLPYGAPQVQLCDPKTCHTLNIGIQNTQTKMNSKLYEITRDLRTPIVPCAPTWTTKQSTTKQNKIHQTTQTTDPDIKSQDMKPALNQTWHTQFDNS